MNSRPNWLEKYRVKNIFRKRKNKRAVYVDSQSNVVLATHYNLNGGTYAVPLPEEAEFLRNYIEYVFGPSNGQLALTENAIVSDSGRTFSSVFIDLDLKYPLESEGK